MVGGGAIGYATGTTYGGWWWWWWWWPGGSMTGVPTAEAMWPGGATTGCPTGAPYTPKPCILCWPRCFIAAAGPRAAGFGGGGAVCWPVIGA